MLFLLITGCSACVSMPDSIPDKRGTVDESEAPDLLTASSPDLPILPWLVVAQLSLEDYRDCPLVYWSSSSLSIDAGGSAGCLDSSGVKWQGTASVTNGAGGSYVFSFEDFGPVSGVDSPWSALGTLLVSSTDTGSGTRGTSTLEVTSYGPGDKRVFWNDTQAAWAFYDGIFYADHVYGTIGLGSWGTAEVDENRVPMSLTNGCAYGMHAAGTIGLFAANEGVFSFEVAGDDTATAGPPPPPFDTGTDTGSQNDTGSGSGGGITVPNPTGDAGDLCGQCVNLAVDGAAVAGCVVPARTISWPFYAPF